jgi:basic membrane lipoprotein Med (substrate-binding protein (PBP1-ABC) superfamily)
MSQESQNIITSAIKLYGTAAVYGLEQYYNGVWGGGAVIHLGAEDECIGLPSDFSRFGTQATIVEDAYEDILNRIATQVIVVPNTISELNTFLNAIGISNTTLLTKISGGY